MRLPDFGIEVVPGGPGRLVVVVTGDLDVNTAIELGATLVTATARAHQVIVDLHGVTFVDGSGMATLVDAAKRASAVGARVILRRPSRPVRRMVHLLCLDEALPTEPPSAPAA